MSPGKYGFYILINIFWKVVVLAKWAHLSPERCFRKQKRTFGQYAKNTWESPQGHLMVMYVMEAISSSVHVETYPVYCEPWEIPKILNNKPHLHRKGRMKVG